MIRSTEKSLNKSGINGVLHQFTSRTGVGILSPAKYDIIITHGGEFGYSDGFFQGSLFQSSSNIDVMKRLSNACESAAFPGRSVGTQPNRIMGPVREMPYESIYSGDLDLTFRVGQDMFERRYFEFWMDRIVNHSTNTMGYYDDYTRDIYIAQLNPADGIVYKVKLTECYPKAINAIDLGYAKTDDYVRQSVSIAFREYEVLSSNGLVSGSPVLSEGMQSRREILRQDAANEQTLAEERANASNELVGSILRETEEMFNTPQPRGFRLDLDPGPSTNLFPSLTGRTRRAGQTERENQSQSGLVIPGLGDLGAPIT